MEEKVNNFLRCQIIDGMKNKIWAVLMEKESAFYIQFTEKDSAIV